MAYVAGDTITAYLNTGQAADTWTVLSAIRPSGTFTPTITEVASGVYKVDIVTSEAGAWFLSIEGAASGQYDASYDVDAATVTAVATTGATSGPTRREMARRVGTKLGDFLLLTATADGSDTTFVDGKRLKTSTQYGGRSLWFAGGANDGQERILGASPFSSATATLTFAPEVPAATAEGDEAELWGERGTGWTRTEVNDALDMAIAEAAQLGGIEVIGTVAALFDSDTASIAIPAAMSHVYAVEYADDDGLWKRVERASGAGRGGYTVRAVDAAVEVLGPWADTLDDRAVRLLGYGTLAPLEDDDDRVGCHPTWLLNATCALLMESGVHRQENRERWALYYQQQADKLKPGAVSIRRPNSERVR
jgi:hypothetical protein